MKLKIREEILAMLKALEPVIDFLQRQAEPSMLIEAVAALQSMDELCCQGLSAQRYPHYGDIFANMIVALRSVRQGMLKGTRQAEALGLCRSLLDYLQQELASEAEVKREIVFLPYKVSMWDSLESIWRAAAADSACNAYVVPIPYADRNPDETVREWHCEADLFPPEVPVLDYRSFDLAKLQPDVIYIHNPYDNRNAATSVDAMYYTGKLKQYTDMLVYVPYFWTGGLWPEAHARHPSYQNIDKIVLPKEHMEIAPEMGSDLMGVEIRHMEDYVPADKLVPLGSPKIDRAFYAEKHAVVPQEWQRIIRGRKVIFYNVSISGMMSQRQNMIKKIRYVLDCFRGRQDVVLLWRPHPLLRGAIESVVPGLLPEYDALLQRVQDEEVGILDLSSEMDRAVAVADAYLGESSSSVVQLFGVLGKPIFFTDEYRLWEKPTEEERSAVRFGGVMISPEKLWFIAEDYNTFCSMERRSGRITPLLKFPDHPFNGGIYGNFIAMDKELLQSRNLSAEVMAGLELLDGRMYFSPCNAQAILEYDPITGRQQEIPLEDPLPGGNFGGIVPYKHYLYFLPILYPAILRYDRLTGECCYYEECLQEFMTARSARKEELSGGYILRGHHLLLTSAWSNKLLDFDMETSEYEIRIIGPEDTQGTGVMLQDDGNPDVYWLLPRVDRAIRKWNYQTGVYEIIDDYPEGYECAKDWFIEYTYRFSGAIKQDGGIWLFPCYGNMILRLDMASGRLEQVELPLPHKLDERQRLFFLQQADFFSVFPTGEHEIAALWAFDRSLLYVDTRSRIWRLQPCRLSLEDVRRLPTPIAECFGPIGKGYAFAVNENVVGRSIDDFLDYAAQGQHPVDKQRAAYSVLANNADGTCGMKVHQYIMEQLGK